MSDGARTGELSVSLTTLPRKLDEAAPAAGLTDQEIRDAQRTAELHAFR